MPEFTPTTESVRDQYAWQGYDEGGEPDDCDYAEFDRWIAGLEATIRADQIEKDAEIALGPSRSGILHDASTGCDIAGAIRAQVTNE